MSEAVTVDVITGEDADKNPCVLVRVAATDVEFTFKLTPVSATNLGKLLAQAGFKMQQQKKLIV